MRKFLFLCLALVSSCALIAQTQRGLKGSYCTDKYPTVSFIWNSPNPDALDKSMFMLKDETGTDIPFQLDLLPVANQNCKKSVLFLWEDMKSHKGQSVSTKELLTGFLRSGLSASDEFNVAVFNRIHSNEKHVLKFLESDYTSYPEGLALSVENYELSESLFKEYPLQTDLYLAINEGINSLKQRPSDRVGIIVVVTAGLNIKASGASTEVETVRKNAIDADIPIYVVKYPEFAGDAPEVNTLAESTYGKVIYLKSGQTAIAQESLANSYQQFDERHYGHDYKITFTTTASKDGKPHNIRLTVNKVEQHLAAFTAPDTTFQDWLDENLMLFIAMIAAALILIILIIWLIHHSIAKKNRERIANEMKLQSQIEGKGKELEDLKKQQLEEKQKQRELAERQAYEAEIARLCHLMEVKNMFPRLQCQIGDNSFTYSMDKPVLTIGRNQDNDLVLNNQTVSGFHAEIRFNGAAFELFNKSKSYTRGIIVNGQFSQNCTLNSGDKIGFGEVVVTFYV